MVLGSSWAGRLPLRYLKTIFIQCAVDLSEGAGSAGSEGGVAAVDGEDRSGDVGRLRRGEEEDRVGDLFGGGETAEGDLVLALAAVRAGVGLALERRFDDRGGGQARGDDVDAD